MVSGPAGAGRPRAGGAPQSPAVALEAPHPADAAAGPHSGAQGQRAPWMPAGLELCFAAGDLDALLELPARFLGGLPAASALVLERVPGAFAGAYTAGELPVFSWGELLVTTSRDAFAAARAAQVPAFHGGELSAMTTAAEAGRLVPGDVARWCDKRLTDPRWVLRVADALDLPRADRPKAAPLGWTLGQVFKAAGLRLTAVYASGGQA